MTWTWDEGCFVCGRDNLGGLQLAFAVDEQGHSIETEWIPPETFQGYPGLLHGGLVATILDEAVGKLAVSLGMPVMTAELVVRYLKPVPTGLPLCVRGRITRVTRRLLLAEAEAILEDGSTGARATAKLMRVTP
jgi:uncharacterized protein (TIGR00369 family)